MRNVKRMARNIAKSVTFAIAEYQHRFDAVPSKIFAELDAYYALQSVLPVRISDPFEHSMKCAGIPVEPLGKPGLGIYLSGDPVLIREFPDPDVQLILPKEG